MISSDRLDNRTMTTKTYEFIPGSVASLLYIRPPGLTGESIACVYMSKERGVVVGRFEKPLAEYGWPMEVNGAIFMHFNAVFGLEHESWKGEGPSPRSAYCDATKPWKVEVEQSEYVVKDEHTLGAISGENMMAPLGRTADGHDWKNGSVSTIGATIRPATRADFETFRVSLPSDWSPADAEGEALDEEFRANAQALLKAFAPVEHDRELKKLLRECEQWWAINWCEAYTSKRDQLAKAYATAKQRAKTHGIESLRGVQKQMAELDLEAAAATVLSRMS